MNPTPEIIEAIITGLIIGLGMVAYRVYQYQTSDEEDHPSTGKMESNGNGFRVAMESVRDAYGTNVELLHEQIYELEKELVAKDLIIERLQDLLLARGIVVSDEGHVISYQPSKIEE